MKKKTVLDVYGEMYARAQSLKDAPRSGIEAPDAYAELMYYVAELEKTEEVNPTRNERL